MGFPALFIIDMQNDFVGTDAPLRVAGAAGIVQGIRMVLDRFREKNLPVFHIVREHRNDGSDVEIIRKDLFARQPFAIEGTRGAAVIDELAPRACEHVIRKIRMSAFIGTGLDLTLRTLGVTDLVITGIQTPNCVRTTVFDAIAYNYPVCLVEDAVAAQTEAVHAANVQDMKNIGVTVISAADLAAFLDAAGTGTR